MAPPPTSSPNDPDCTQHIVPGAVVGASLGSFVAGILLSLVVIYFKRKKELRHSTDDIPHNSSFNSNVHHHDNKTVSERVMDIVKKRSGDSLSDGSTTVVGHHRHHRAVTRKLSEEGWSWRDKRNSPIGYSSFAELRAHESRGSPRSVTSIETFHRQTSAQTLGHGHSTPSLPAILKERGLAQEPGYIHGNVSNLPSYQTSMHEAESSPGSLYSQASATTFQHRRIAAPSESSIVLPTAPRHPSLRRKSHSGLRTSATPSPENDSPPLPPVPPLPASILKTRKRADSNPNPVQPPKEPQADSASDKGGDNNIEQHQRVPITPLMIVKRSSK